MSDLRISSDDRIEFSVTRHVHKVSSILGKCLIIALRVLAGHTLIASDTVQCLKEFFSCDVVLCEDFCARRTVFRDQSKINVLDTDIFISELLCYLLCIHENVVKTSGAVHRIGASADLRQFVNFSLDIPCDSVRIDAHRFDEFWDETVFLLKQREMNMLTIDHLMAHRCSDVLAVQHDLLGILCIFFYVH